MEYQKMIILLDNTTNDDARGTSMLRSSLCDFSDAYILVKGTVTVERLPTQQQHIMQTKK